MPIIFLTTGSTVLNHLYTLLARRTYTRYTGIESCAKHMLLLI